MDKCECVQENGLYPHLFLDHQELHQYSGQKVAVGQESHK
jgi:hypothetical protein